MKTLQSLWNVSSPFRHAVTAFLALNLALPLSQVAAWAQSKGAQPLPNWRSVLVDLGYSAVAAGIAAFLKWAQNRKAFPPTE